MWSACSLSFQPLRSVKGHCSRSRSSVTQDIVETLFIADISRLLHLLTEALLFSQAGRELCHFSKVILTELVSRLHWEAKNDDLWVHTVPSNHRIITRELCSCKNSLSATADHPGY